MASSSNIGALAMGKNDEEILILDQPCEYCKLLQLNEEKHCEAVRYKSNGKGFLFFGNVDVAAAREYYDDVALREKEEQGGKFLNLCLKLGYRREDILPGLPGLATTASQGCAFCDILRGDIISILPTLGNAFKSLDDSSEPGQHKLIITEVSYKLRERQDPGVTEDVTSLTELYVYFTFDIGGKSAGNHSLHYEFYAEPSDPCATWFNIRKRPFSNQLLSTPAVNRLCELIAQSSNEIPVSTDNVYLPTRLLDVGSTTAACLRLVATNKYPQLQSAATDAAAKRYATLSYCWGIREEAGQQLKTTGDTLQERLSGINFQSLPQTIADAVQLCRAIGMQYLWIDALCIIQDDNDDWTRESFEMSSIYYNSFITLCVVMGASCSSGFLIKQHNPRTLQINFHSQLDSSVKGQLYLRMCDHVTLNLMTDYTEASSALDALTGVERSEPLDWHSRRDAPWYKRGWTFQEGHFSKRRFLIGDDMVYMWYNNDLISMDGTQYSERRLFSEVHKSLGHAMRNWYFTVRIYIQRELSYERDRFPAFSGLAKTLAESYPDQEYLAGLWRADLHRGLLWIPETTENYQDYIKPRSYGYVAPSWSWAHCPGTIHWLPGIGYDDDISYTPEFELQNANVVTDRLNPYGRVFSACLELDAKIYELPLGSDNRAYVTKAPDEEKYYLHPVPFQYLLRSDNGDYVAHVHFDWDFWGRLHDDSGYPEAPIDEMRMLLISSCKLNDRVVRPPMNTLLADPEMMTGLVVMPTRNSQEFIRVGLWHSVTKGLGGRKLWEDIQPRFIKLV